MVQIKFWIKFHPENTGINVTINIPMNSMLIRKQNIICNRFYKYYNIMYITYD